MQFDEPASAMVMVRITPSQRRHLEQVAADNRTSLTGVVREAVNEYVADYGERKVFRIATRPDTGRLTT